MAAAKPQVLVRHFEKYETWEDFAKRFQDHRNPVLEYWRRDRGMVSEIAGDYALVLILHHDITDATDVVPFLAELPWSLEAAQYIHANAVNIAKLPDLTQWPNWRDTYLGNFNKPPIKK